MSLLELFDDDTNTCMAGLTGEPVRLEWGGWNQPRTVSAIVDDGFVDDAVGDGLAASKAVLTIELAESAVPVATPQALKQGLVIYLTERPNCPKVHVLDFRPLGAGAVQLIGELA